MKDSGIDWIGEIPSNWTIKKFKYLSNPRKENSKEGTEELLSATFVACLLGVTVFWSFSYLGRKLVGHWSEAWSK